MSSIRRPAGRPFRRRGFLHLAAGLAASTALSALGASCGTLVAGTPPSIQGEVLVWAPPLSADDSAYWSPLSESLRQAHPRLDLKVETVPWAGRSQRLLTATASGGVPDVAYVSRDLIPRLADDSSIVAVDGLLAPELRDDLHPRIRAQAPYRERFWGVPAVVSIHLPFVNINLASAAGLGNDASPSDWTSLTDWGRRLTIPPDRWGLAHRWSSDTAAHTLIGWIWQAGGEVVEEPNGRQALFNSDAGVEALAYVKSLFDAGYVQIADKYGQGAEFGSGRIGVLLWGSVGTPSQLASTTPGLAYTVGGAIAGRRRVATGMLASYAILSAAPNRPGAEALARLLARPQSLARIARVTGYLPPVRSLSAESLWPGDVARARMLAQIDHIRLDIQHPYARTLSRILAEEGQAALIDRKTPAEALANAARRFAAEVSR